MQLKSQLLLTSALSSAAALSGAGKPNLLIIHTDEHNFRTLSCYQQQLSEEQAFVWGAGVNVKTPNIDRIANEGAISNRHYCSTAVSTPSRASLVSGLYPQATGAYKNGMHLSKNIPTLGTILRDNGYSTAYVGKWHLAGDEEQYAFNVKYNAGFDDNRYMMTGGHAPYFVKNEDGKLIVPKGYKNIPQDKLIHLTDYFTDCTIEIINRDAKEDKPFAIMLSIPDPHTPDIAKPEYYKLYKDMKPMQPQTMLPELAAARPAWAYGNKNGEMKTFNPEKLKHYFGMVKHIDDAVGRMLATLEQNGKLDNTIVIFTADHGDMFYEHSRMNKGVPYDASVKVPFVIRYPKKIKGGKVVNSASANCDVIPTVLTLMDVDYEASTFHGIDMSKDYTSKNKIVTGNRITFAENNYGKWALAGDSRYKLIISPEEKPWLIDLEENPDETINYYTNPKYKSIVERLQPVLLSSLKKYKSPHEGKYKVE